MGSARVKEIEPYEIDQFIVHMERLRCKEKQPVSHCELELS